MSNDLITALIVAPFVGSFLGTLILRLPNRESFVVGRSYCPSCGETLGGWDLIPIFTWLFTHGRCRHCAQPVSFFYPAIELLALAVPAWAALAVPAALLWPTCYLGWSLLALAIIDYRHFILPDLLTYPLIAVGLLVAWWGGADAFRASLIGAVCGFAIFALIAHGYRRFRGRDGLGLGDAKLLAALGAWDSWAGLPFIILLGSMTALLFAFAVLRRSYALKSTTKVPFGTFLAIGGWGIWVYAGAFHSIIGR